MLGIRLVWVFFIVAILQSLATASDDDEKEKKNMLIGTFCNNQTYEQIPGMVPKGMIKAGAYSIPAGISSAHACAIECCGSLIGGGNSTGCDVALFQKGICYHLVCKSVDSCSPIKDDALKTETIFIAVSQVKSIWESSTDATTRNYLTTAPSTTTTPKLHTTQKPTATHKLTIMEMSKKAIALPKTTDKIMTTTASVELNHSELLDSIESSTRLAIPQDNFCNTTQGCPAGWECLPVIINQTEKSNFPTSPGPPASEDIVTKKCRKRLISTTGLSGRPTTATNTTAETMSKPNQQPQADILNAKESYTAGTSVVFDGQGK